MKPDISVVIPAYNCASLLPCAVKSVRMQNWPGVEIIIVDDGSVDNTAEIIASLAGGELRSFSQPNGGPAAARNLGIKQSNAKWIAFLDADDLWLPGKLREQMPVLEANPNLAFSYCDCLCRKADGSEFIVKPFIDKFGIFSSLLLCPQIMVGTMVVRRDLFDRFGYFDTELRTGEDWDMWLRIAANCEGGYIPKELFVYRLHGKAGKYPMELMERCTLRILERILSERDVYHRWPEIWVRRRLLYAWHYAVLAKSYLYHRKPISFCRMAFAAVCSHPKGLYFLARRWGGSAGYPCLLTQEPEPKPSSRS